MSLTRAYTIDETIVRETLRNTDVGDETNMIMHALASLREAIRKDIKDSFWQCPVHGTDLNSRNDCEECDECMEVNVILNDILRAKSLNDSPTAS